MRTGLALTCSYARLLLVGLRDDIDADLRQHMRLADPDATTLCAVLTHIDAALKLLPQQAGKAKTFPAGDEE